MKKARLLERMKTPFNHNNDVMCIYMYYIEKKLHTVYPMYKPTLKNSKN